MSNQPIPEHVEIHPGEPDSRSATSQPAAPGNVRASLIPEPSRLEALYGLKRRALEAANKRKSQEASQGQLALEQEQGQQMGDQAGLGVQQARNAQWPVLDRMPAHQAKPSSTPEPLQQLILPYGWAENLRAVPNFALRSALGAVAEPGNRPVLNNVQIAAQAGLRIFYSGPQLDQNDLTVWYTVLHACRFVPIAAEHRHSPSELLSYLDMSVTGGSKGSIQALDARLQRLMAGTIRIEDKKYVYNGHLIDVVMFEKSTGEYIIKLNKDIQELFTRSSSQNTLLETWRVPTEIERDYTLLDWQVRSALSRGRAKQLALWLHGHYSSHGCQTHYSVEKLRTLCGSKIAEIGNFKKKLIKALDDVVKACNQAGQSFEYEIVDNIVHTKKGNSKQG